MEKAIQRKNPVLAIERTSIIGGTMLSGALKKIIGEEQGDSSDDKRELLTRSAAAFATKVVSAALALLLTALITRAIGAHQAGYYFWSLALITVLATFARTGFDQVLLRFMSAALADQRTDRAYAIFHYAMRKTLSAALLVALAMTALSPLMARWIFRNSEVALVLSIMGVASIFLALNTLQSQSLLAAKRVLTSIFVLEIGVPLIMVMLLSIAAPRSAVAISTLYLSASFILVIAFSGYWQRRAGATAPTLDVDERAQINNVRTHLFGVASLSLISQWGGVILLGWFTDSAEIALFSIALRVAMVNSFILRAVNAVVGTRFAQFYHHGDIAGLRSLAMQSTRLMVVIAVPMLCLLLIFGRPLLMIFGTEFVAATTCLAILSLGQFINVMTGAVCLLLEMTGGEAQLRRFELISALVMVAMGFVLVPLYGAIGAAIATACSVASVNLLAAYEVKRRFGFNMLNIGKMNDGTCAS